MLKINYVLFRFSLITVFAFFIISCADHSDKENHIIEVNLGKEKAVGPFLRTLVPFSFIDSLEIPLKGIPNIDSLVIQKLFFFSPKRLNLLYEADSISKKEYDNFINGIYAVSGLEDDEQFFALDLNNDGDFSNDKYIRFNKNISKKTRNDITLRDAFEIVNIGYNSFDRDSIIDIQRSLRIFPYSDYFEFKNPTDELKMYARFQLVSEINEYWYGTYLDDNLNLKIAVNSSPHFGDQIVISENDLPFPKTKNSQYFKHKVGDTLVLNKSYYRIDSLNPQKTKLYFKELGELSSYYGYLTGDRIKDLHFKDINGNIRKVSEVFEDKPYVLLDFWGTWCGPCKELTPRLKEINEAKKSFNILSVAYENRASREEVLEYVVKNKMVWLQTYELKDSLNRQSSFTYNLKVKTFPTFIVLDREFNIVYRGFGKDALMESIKFMDSTSITN